jgi:prohibitin 2
MVLPSIVVEVLKSTVAAFDADKLVTEREAVSKMIYDKLKERAMVYGIELKDVAITEFHFSPMYEAAVERKQISQQNAQRAQIMVRKAYQEKQQKIVEAQGEEQSARLVGAMIAENPAYLNLEKIKAAKEIANVIAQSTNRVYLNSESLLLDVNAAQIDASQLGKGKTNVSSW